MTFIQHNSLTHQHTCVPTRTGGIRTPSQSLASSATKFRNFSLDFPSTYAYEGESAILLSSITMYVLAGALYRNPDPWLLLLIQMWSRCHVVRMMDQRRKVI